MINLFVSSWPHAQTLSSRMFTCGFCQNQIASKDGWDAVRPGPIIDALVRICPQCHCPTLLVGNEQFPGVAYGNVVRHLPKDIESLYDEARSAIISAPTATVLCCRKLLMHVAVEKKAEEGKSFEYYVQYLEDNNFIPAGAKGWVDQIRKRGNEANHLIKIKTRAEAEELIDLVEMLLKVIYDYPSRGAGALKP